MTSDDLQPKPDEAAVPQPAATTVLIRDGQNGIETWMMQRVKAMAFAAGAAVFPGGRIDPRDADITVAWTGSDPETFADRFGTDPATARALVTGALRELFEETGILLAEPLPALDLEQARRAVEGHDLPLAQLLAEHGCALATSNVHPWARWVTPPMERRRYDTWFFVVTLPPGVEAASVSTEAETADWFRPQDMLDAGRRGDSLVLPPTQAMLEGLIQAGSVAEVVARAPGRSLAAVHPEVRRTPEGAIEVVGAGHSYLMPAPPA